jgi:RHS repeat-associated protein
MRQLADGDGDVTLAQGYTPFGVPMWDSGSGTTGYGFTGERWEAYSQLLFLRARYYEPEIGLFLSKDSWPGNMKQPVTLHGWVYGQNNPIIYVDPTGHQDIPSSLCPCSPSGKYWKFVGIYRITPYGHAVHEKFAKVAADQNRDAREEGKKEPWPEVELQWKDAEDKHVVHSTWVSSLWLEHVRPETGEGTAGKLEGTDKGTVYIKCPSGTHVCVEQKEEKAKSGAAGTRLRPYKDGAINIFHNNDLALHDTVYIEGGAGIISIRDTGEGQGKWGDAEKAKWIDLYIGEHGRNDWDRTIFGRKKVWVLKPIPYPTPCDWDIAPSTCPR